jgi:hypothetical protein
MSDIQLSSACFTWFRESIEKGRSTVSSHPFNVKKSKFKRKKYTFLLFLFFFLIEFVFLTLKEGEGTVERPLSINSRSTL